jgi:transglutaminase-like putative cysteine protease
MRCIGGSKYTPQWSESREAELEDEFAPFLRPSQMVNYTADSQCVEKAWEVTKTCQSDVEIAGNIYRYLVENLSYDQAKAASVQAGYLPDPDATLAEGKGICFDYAALAAAMLRSQGIPCQLITGYVGGEELYHAWNRFYVKEKGWITAEISASARDWKRVDITFASQGVSDKELEKDAEYTTRYTY